MKKTLLAGLLLAACGAAFSANANIVRLPVLGIKAAGGVGSPGETTPDPKPVDKAVLSVVSSIDLGSTLLGVAVTGSFQVSNTGTKPLTVGLIARPGGDFVSRANGVGICKNGTVLNAGENCTVTVTFTPTVAGPRMATFALDSDAGSASVQLTGVGTLPLAPLDVMQAPAAALGPFAVDQTTGLPSITYQFKNNGNVTLSGKAVSVISQQTGQTSGAISSNTCLAPVAPQGTCGFTVSPVNTHSSNITLSYNETTLTTVTSYAMMTESPTLIYVSSSVSNNTKYFTMRNPNKVVPVTITGVNIVDNSYKDIRSSFVVQNCAGTTIPPGGTCKLQVSFRQETVVNSVNVIPVVDTTSDGPIQLFILPAGKWW